MSGAYGAASLEGPSEESGSGEWRRIYDRVEALLPRVEALAADRNRLEEIDRIHRELSEARENALHARLLQAEASRRRWKTAYIELPLLANPKITELQEIDLKDYSSCEDDDNSQLKVHPKEARTGVELKKNNENHEGIAEDLRAELRKLKQEYKTLGSNKDKEICKLHGVIDFLWNKLRTFEKEKNDEIQKLKKGQPESLKRKCASSLSDEVSQDCSKDIDETMELEEYMETSQECSKDMDEMDLDLYTIFAKILDGKTKVKQKDTIFDVKAKIQDKEGIPACDLNA